jgi:fumarate reductase (CoM/CoB) subunit A
LESIVTDVLIIGAGGAGLRAAIESEKHNVDVLIVNKTLAGRCNTVMAEGGYNAALGSADPNDHPDIHFRDSVEGGVWLCDQDKVEVLCKDAIPRIYDLEDFGVVFDRTPEGKIAQTRSGKQTYPRVSYVADYTGLAMTSALLSEVRRLGIPILEETYVHKIFTNDGRVAGALAISIRDGEAIAIRAKSIILTTGGLGQLFEITTNPLSATGDGRIMALDAGAELQDMEMAQIHPTAMVWPPSVRGSLVTESCRGIGGVLFNTTGERFMEKYHPMKELGPRDVVTRAIMTEVLKGNGTAHGGVYLSLTHLPPEQVKKHLYHTYQQFLRVGIDMTKEPVEVAPSMHFHMGGVRANVRCETSVKGLFVAGEEMAGVHGANRLGGNALVATQVFGKIAGENAAKYAKSQQWAQLDSGLVEEGVKEVESAMRQKRDGVDPLKIRKMLSKAIWNYAGVFRDEGSLMAGLMEINRIKEILPRMSVDEGSKVYNKRLIEYLETLGMVRLGEILIHSALLRTESRGAHYRSDYPKTDNVNWLKHIVWFSEGKSLKYRFEPVVITKYPPPNAG